MRDPDECRPYVMHLHTAHHRIHTMVHDVQSMFAQASTQHLQQFGPQLAERLGGLRRGLAHHFTEEEQGGCIEEAICHCPSLSREADELEEQHGKLLDLLDNMIRFASATLTTLESVKEIEAEFREFTKRLHVHETAENRILQQAFGFAVEGEEGA